jgi:hypothetical protein
VNPAVGPLLCSRFSSSSCRRRKGLDLDLETEFGELRDEARACMNNGLGKFWLGRQDSNLGMAAPKAAALPLGDAPAERTEP